jgi:hypothetical protein
MDKLNKLLSFISDDELSALALATDVNKHTKKLQGQLLFKLMVYCFVTEKQNSLRGMQSALESAIFRALSGTSAGFSVAHSSISERLNVISCDFFEKIFIHCSRAYGPTASQLNGAIVRFDSTIVSMSTKLLNIGYNLPGGDAEKYRLLKFTVGYSDMPDCICFHKDQAYNSENKALSEAILSNQKIAGQINVFDRGITSRDHYDKLTQKDILFVSRITPGAKQEIYKGNTLKKPVDTETLKIVSDSWAYLYTSHKKRSSYPVRLIEAIKKENGTPLVFITNIKDLKGLEITEIYRSRWDIEVFFKFIKQHLNFTHLLNRTENGIKVVMYVTMTVAILLAEYKKQNKLTGFKIPKKKFAQELENDILYNFVILCEGNPAIAKKLIYPNSS